MSIDTMQELLVEELRDLYDAEKQLLRALPKMARAASSGELKAAFQTHKEVTGNQVARLEQAFQMLDQRARSKPCKGMKGLVEEGQEVMEEEAEDPMHDLGIIGAAMKVEHYEIAGYNSVRTLAMAQGLREVAGLLQQSLQEEMETEKQLSMLAKQLMKQKPRMDTSSEETGRGRRSGSSAATAGRGGRTSRAAQTKGTARRSAKSNSGRSTNSRGRSASASRSGSNRGSSKTSSKEGGRSSRSKSSSSSQMTTDHDQIRRWAEQRGGQPACVRGTGNKGDIGILRLDFPGYSGAESLEHISWDDWFDKFDERGLAVLYQEKTAGGRSSNFNKIVNREG
jgi:ferritin-like metal-binding protein YciE